MTNFTPRIVLVAAPSMEEARNLAEGLLKKRLAACVNLVPGAESHYWWQGKLEKAEEVLMVIKTSAEQFEAVEKLIHLHHSYDCPEITAISPQEITPSYRVWWEKEMNGMEEM
ncbi:MAG: divalent-cation tolerance protein CutA [Methylacidiphilales bacterium]|nr:divalent-cation tolerance protein CutA [Candidatus Methylacidiphilales bacterium]